MVLDNVMLPTHLSCFELNSELGRGGYGVVYRATLTEDQPYAPAGSTVALKVLRTDVSDTMARRFEREAAIGQALDHPTLVRTFELRQEKVEPTASAHCLVMEYVEARTLQQILRQRGTLPESFLRALAQNVTTALSILHDAGAIHRDIKPTNLLITEEYEVKLTDFGIVNLTEPDGPLTATGIFVGTVAYAAPEQLSGQPLTPRADLYSLGVLLYEAATGVQPFETGDFKATLVRNLMMVPESARTLRPDLSPFFVALLDRLLEKEPGQRFQSAAELLEVLEQGEHSIWWREHREPPEPTGWPPHLRSGPGTPKLPFAGRDRELGQLVEQWQHCVQGRGSVLLIQGDTGIGKSRLLDETIELIERLGTECHVLYGAENPALHLGLGSLSQALLDSFGIPHLTAQLAARVPQMAEMVHRIVPLLLDERPVDKGKASLPWATLTTFFRLLAQALAKERPVLWMVDDFHFASAQTQELIGVIARVASRFPIVLVLTHSADWRPTGAPWIGDRVHRMELKRLHKDAVQGIVSGLFGSPQQRPLMRHIAERSDGHPLFLAEMIREANHATLGDFEGIPSGTLEIPASVRELLLERLEGLETVDRNLLNIAAVQGFHFDPEVLATVRGISVLEVLERLGEIERRFGLLRGLERNYRFEHHLLQDLLFENLSPMLRRQYHQRIAEALESTQPAEEETDNKRAVTLCEHFLKAGATQSALPYSTAALDHLSVQCQLDRMLDLTSLLLGAVSVDDRKVSCDVLLRRSDCLFRLGRCDESFTAAGEALDHAEALGDERLAARACFAQGRAVADKGPEAYALLEDALERAEVSQETPWIPKILGQLSFASMRDGKFAQSLTYFERQQSYARAEGDQQSLATAELNAGVAWIGLNRFEAAREHLERSIELSRAQGLLEEQTRAQGYLASVWNWLGYYNRAKPLYEQVIEQARSLDLMEIEVLNRLNFAWNSVYQGDLAFAEKLYEEGLALAEASRLVHFHAYTTIVRAEIARGQGDQERESRLFEQAITECDPSHGFFRLLLALHGAGRVRFELDDRQGARTHFERAQTIVQEHEIALFRPLIELYSTILDDGAIHSFEIPEETSAHLTLEFLLLLYEQGQNADALGHASGLLDRIANDLREEERPSFWRYNALARKAFPLVNPRRTESLLIGLSVAEPTTPSNERK